jgi:hypothetical protein
MHALLIAGAALVGLPILLHLIMKQEPKRLAFPAFRFLRQQLKTNQRKLRLRHFLLLALRMLLIALFCLALYQPSLPSGGFSITGQQPVAVVIVLDTSPSMGYVDNGRTRLEEAKRRALELLDELPDKSAVAVVETGDAGGFWVASVTEARKRISEVKEARGSGQPVSAAIATAYQLFRTVEQETDSAEVLPRLVAVFTDRAAASWDATRTEDLKKLRDTVPDPKPVHAVIDVGVEQPANVAILNAEMKPQVVPGNQPAVVTVTVGATGPDVEAVVAAKLVDGKSPERKPVAVPGGQTRSVSFEFRDLPPGLHQLELSLGTPDKLKFDDTRFYTFRVAEPRKILTIADDPDEATYWEIAHDTKGDFANTTVKPGGVKAADLFQYEVVCLLGVSRPGAPTEEPLWEKLRKYVEGGGKLVIIPGDKDRMTPADYDPGTNTGANRLMPGKLRDVVNTRDVPAPEKDDEKAAARRTGSAWYLDNERDLQHPLLAPFREWKKRGNIDFLRTPRRAWKYWDVEKLNVKEASVVVQYDDSDDPAKRRPAVLERTVGKGKVMLLTTRLDPPGDRGTEWNDYWELADSTWYVVFPNLVVKSLAGDAADANFNHPTGQTITVPLPRTGGKREDIALEGPGVGINDGLIKPAEKQVELRLGPPRTLSAGNFKLVPVSPAPEWAAGFSLNAAPEESQLDKVPAAAVEELTGPDRVFPVGRDAKLGDILVGRVIDYPVDLFPWLLILVLLLLAAEGLVANRFYRRRRP